MGAQVVKLQQRGVGAMPLDYSKWDKLDDSDDEKEAKPASPKKVAAALEGKMRARERERAHERAKAGVGERDPPSLPLTGARRAGGGGGQARSGAGEAREAQASARQCMERKCAY